MERFGLCFQIPKNVFTLTMTELYIWKLLNILKSLPSITDKG